MNGLLTHSNLSFESVESAVPRPSSILSFATDTSTATVDVQGIGTLSGRMIYAVGEVALRGVENLAIRRRLAKSISAFPHKDDDIIKDIETIYDHAFELSRYFTEFSANQVLKRNLLFRFGLYRAQVQRQALRVLLIQISTRQTRQLLRSLVKWPSIEIALFISEILTCMPDSW
jgi:hypothetical protein